MLAAAGVGAGSYGRISVPPAATRVSIPALPDILPDQGSHVSVAAIRFTFTVRRTIPAPVRGRTRCHERPARPVSPVTPDRRDAAWLHREAGPVRRHEPPDGRAPRSRE